MRRACVVFAVHGLSNSYSNMADKGFSKPLRSYLEMSVYINNGLRTLTASQVISESKNHAVIVLRWGLIKLFGLLHSNPIMYRKERWPRKNQR